MAERVAGCVLCATYGVHEGEHSSAFFITERGVLRPDEPGKVRDVEPSTADERVKP